MPRGQNTTLTRNRRTRWPNDLQCRSPRPRPHRRPRPALAPTAGNLPRARGRSSWPSAPDGRGVGSGSKGQVLVSASSMTASSACAARARSGASVPSSGWCSANGSHDSSSCASSRAPRAVGRGGLALRQALGEEVAAIHCVARRLARSGRGPVHTSSRVSWLGASATGMGSTTSLASSSRPRPAGGGRLRWRLHTTSARRRSVRQIRTSRRRASRPRCWDRLCAGVPGGRDRALAWAGPVGGCARMVEDAWLVSMPWRVWRSWVSCGHACGNTAVRCAALGVPRRTRAVPSGAAGTAFAHPGAGAPGASSAHPARQAGLRPRALRVAPRGEVGLAETRSSMALPAIPVVDGIITRVARGGVSTVAGAGYLRLAVLFGVGLALPPRMRRRLPGDVLCVGAGKPGA